MAYSVKPMIPGVFVGLIAVILFIYYGTRSTDAKKESKNKNVYYAAIAIAIIAVIMMFYGLRG